MPATTIFDIVELKQDFLNVLRANLNSSDPRNRVSEETLTLVSTAGQTVFNIDEENISYVKSVTVNAVAKTLHDDYIINWSGTNIGSITFNSGLLLNDIVVIVWGDTDGGSSFIYPDFPRTDLSENTQPRIGFKITDASVLAGAAGGTGYGIFHDLLIQIKIVGRDTFEVDTIAQAVNNYILPNMKNFYYFRFIEPKNIQEYDNFADNTKQSFSKVMEYEATKKLQIVTFA